MAEAARRHERRHLSFSFDREGFFVIHGRLSLEDGAAAAALEEINLELRAHRRQRLAARLDPHTPRPPPGRCRRLLGRLASRSAGRDGPSRHGGPGALVERG
ncbi:MAG: hypothetical protein ACRDJ4_10885 [Actinomycetota bacterium]